jgi:hypothetical protein
MLTFRPINYQTDVPEIIRLLKTSLSDNHTASNFLWKHYDNPFGKSYGLLACDEGQIVGVRMFMFWEFRQMNKIVRAIRPVDTITHPNYRGRGIFKKLTLEGLQKNEGNYDIIFNTPNSNSFPGYLKLGWKKFDHPLNYYISIILPSSGYSKQITLVERIELPIGITEFPSEFFKTNFTENYFKWRFRSNEYSFAMFKEDNSILFLIYRIKRIKGIKTLILIDYVGLDRYLKKALKGLAKKLRLYAIYHLENKELFQLTKRVGGSVVVHKEDNNSISNNIKFSLADLEGRL